MKYKTILTAKAQIVKPHTDDFKAIATSLKDTYGFELKPQMDLLYVRSCLVSAGPGVGVNDNDDIFTREEAWASRHSPVLKPFNWQHNDKDILGVIYTVQARNLDGEILDISDETPPDCDFDLWVEAAIFSLIHEARAAEIESRAKDGTLFVSMEAWFDDYSYGLCQSDKSIKVLARNQSTAFLEKHLRATGGPGLYRDPESNQDVRIGRVLKSVTFGGCGFVDRPANKRSVIEAVGPMNTLADHNADIRLLLQKVLESVEVNTMNLNAGKPAPAGDEIGAAVESALERREKAAAAERAQQELVSRADNAVKQAQDLQSKIEELGAANQVKETQVQTLNKQLTDYNNLVSQLVKDEQAAAGATSSTPAEISAIDAAKDGDAAFSAKLAWLQKSMSALKVRAARADVLEKQLVEAEAVVREQEVRALLGDVVSEEALEKFVAHAATLAEDAYQGWRDEKELMILEIAAKKPPFPPAKKGAKPPVDEEEEEEEVPAKNGCANLFATLLNKRRSESGSANPDTMDGNPNEPKLINQPLGPGVNCGVNPGSLKTPRHKLAGSAGDNPAKKLENAQAEGGVSLAGAQSHDDGEGVSPFRVLANLVADVRETKEDEKQGEKRPGFDPVQ
jgi:TolA-binding protein